MKTLLLLCALLFATPLSPRAEGPRAILTTPGFVVIGAKPTEDEARGVFRRAKFLRQCFVMAALYVRSHRNAKLIHGTMTTFDGETIAHAWVLTASGKVFDGVEQEFFDRASYYDTFNAREEYRYSHAEMMELISKTKRFGPWQPTKGTFDYGAK